MATLGIRNVHKAYGNVKVLQDIDIQVSDGEFLVLVGPSGCGKSTLLNMIAGLETVTGGTIEIDGVAVNDLPPAHRDIAMVFQSYALYPTMTVEQNMAFGLEMRGVSKADRKVAVQRVAQLLQIEPLLKRKPSRLSGGQRQRVAMGRALVRDPKIFLFDEPLSNLDAKLRVEMRTEIKKLHQRLSTTIVYVTHDQIEAMTMATRIAVMHGGDLQQLDTPKAIYDRPVNTFVATFMGSPPMNLIAATVQSDTNGHSLEVDNGNGKDRVAIPPGVDTGALENGQPVLLGLRPEWILEAESPGGSTDNWCFTQRIEVVEPTGANTLVLFELNGDEVTVLLGGDSRVAVGDSLAFEADVSRAILFDADSGQALNATTDTAKH